MNKLDPLRLRGAIELLSKAIVHVGRGHRTNDYDGRYMNPAIESADCTLRKALWYVEREFEKC